LCSIFYPKFQDRKFLSLRPISHTALFDLYYILTNQSSSTISNWPVLCAGTA